MLCPSTSRTEGASGSAFRSSWSGIIRLHQSGLSATFSPACRAVYEKHKIEKAKVKIRHHMRGFVLLLVAVYPGAEDTPYTYVTASCD